MEYERKEDALAQCPVTIIIFSISAPYKICEVHANLFAAISCSRPLAVNDAGFINRGIGHSGWCAVCGNRMEHRQVGNNYPSYIDSGSGRWLLLFLCHRAMAEKDSMMAMEENDSVVMRFFRVCASRRNGRLTSWESTLWNDSNPHHYQFCVNTHTHTYIFPIRIAYFVLRWAI